MIATLHAGGISTLFNQGQKNFGFGISSSRGFGNNYTVVGANFNYFVLESLSAGIGYNGWFGHDPKIHEVTIPVTYYYTFTPQYHPYIGGLYRHTFIGDSDSYNTEDYDVYGARIGLAITMGGNTYMQLGWVQEHRTHGDESDDEGYPEVSMGFVF
jgi:hypothetical protein